jgi:hypothetical protein
MTRPTGRKEKTAKKPRPLAVEVSGWGPDESIEVG